MKAKDWAATVPLDMQGLALLGAALYLRAGREMRESRGEPWTDPDDWTAHPEHRRTEVADADVPRGEKPKARLRRQMAKLVVPLATWRRARTVTLRDFRWRWHHLRDAPMLTLCIKPKLPRWALDHGAFWPDIVISTLSGHAVIFELEGLFEAEMCRLRREPDELEPMPRTRDEIWWSLMVWELCEPERDGRPRGSGYVDSTDEAASHAWSIRHRTGVSCQEAVKRAFRYCKVVERFPDGSERLIAAHSVAVDEPSVLFASSAKAAQKRVYEKLLEYEKTSPACPRSDR